MKKKFIAIICALACLAATLAGCVTLDNYTKINVVGRQDDTYVVTSNGGSAVQYGNYVYFVNGYRGYEDADATANKFGEVVMGALYRAELFGSKIDSNYGEEVKDFRVDKNADTGISMVADKVLNYKYQDSYDVKTQLISPKTIGTSGYKDGGIWIYDDCVYYASPDNEKTRNGEVKDDYTAFFRAKLDGSETVKLYVTETESTSAPYSFYKYNGQVYLVVLEGSEVKSIRATSSNPSKTVTKIAENVQSVVFPTNPVYYKGMETNSVYDYIYVKYNANDYYNESNNTNVVLEYKRPDGTAGRVFEDGNASLDLVAVRDDAVFYKTEKNGEIVLVARDYQSIFGRESGESSDAGFNEVILFGNNLSAATEVYPFATGAGAVNSNRVGVLTITEGSEETVTLNLHRNGTSTVIDNSEGITVQFVDDEKIYYTVIGQTGALRSYDITSMSDGEYKVITTDTISQDGLYFDKVGPYLVYMGQLEGKFNTYTFFYDTYAYESIDAPLFVGQRLANDNRSHIEFISITDKTLANIVTEYKVGDSIDLTGLELTVKEFRNKDGVVVTRTIPVTADMISGFDTSVPAATVTVTVTYTEKGDTFNTITYDISVIE